MSKEKEYESAEIPSHYKSLKTGNEFSYEEYSNHGYSGFKSGKAGQEYITRNDLPLDEYPYTVIYKPNPKREQKWKI